MTEAGRVFRFVLLSASAGLIEMGSFSLLNEFSGLRYWPCYLIALTLSVLWNFTLNRKFTFKSAANVPVAMLKVAAFYVVFTPLSTLFVKYLTETAGWNEYLVTILNMLIKLLGGQPVYFLGSNETFQQTIIWTDVWKGFGYGTVVYLAAMTGIDPSLYEAATIDGAGRFQQMLHVTLPGIRMVITLMMVLSLGNVLNAGFDQIYNLYSPVVYETGDILDTMVYRLGLESAKYGPAAAVGMFKSLISCLLVSVSYYVAIRFFDYRLF